MPSFGFAGTKPFTLEAWARPAGNTGTLISKVYNPGDGKAHGYTLALEANAGLVFTRYPLGAAPVTVTRSLGLVAEAWSHVVATYDGDAMFLFVDGELAAPSTPTSGAIENGGFFGVGSTGGQSPGSLPWQRPWNGAVDELAVYDQALPAVRVARHFAVGAGRTK